MPSNVSTVPLGTVTTWISGGTPSKDEIRFWGGNVPWISANSMQQTRLYDSDLHLTEEGLANGSRLVPAGTLLLLVRGSTLHKRVPVGIAMRPVALNQDVKAILPKSCLDSWYLLYWFLAKEAELLTQVDYTGIGAGKLDTKQLQALEIHVPPLETQIRQVASIKAIDDKIELNSQIAATLEEMARTIFQSWFVNFDPVKAKMRAKAEGRDPERAAMTMISGKMEAELDALPTESLNSLVGVASLFPESFDNLTTGKIPAGWRHTEIGVITTHIFSGGTPDTRKPEYWNGNLNWFSSGETRNAIVTGTEKHITALGVSNSSTRLVKPGDVLIASAGQGTTRGQTSYCATETYINQSVVAVRADSKTCSSVWLFYELSRRYDDMRALSDSHSSRGSLTTKLVSGMKVLCPPHQIIEAFVKIVTPMIERQKQNLVENETLSRLRDTLLPKLLSGEFPE